MKTDELQILLKRFSGRLSNLELVGRGQLASVFRAQDSKCGKTCALKVFHKGPPEFLKEYTKHLLNIQKSLTEVAPTGLLIPYEAGESAGIYYEMLDYLPGVRDLNHVIESGGLPLVEALEVLAQVADGLNYLHAHNLIHADVKPNNILIASEGDTKAYLIDPGMVQQIEQEETTIFVSTYKYIHPDLKSTIEPFGREAPGRHTLRRSIGPFIDIYALGVVAFMMFTGEGTIPHPLSENALVLKFRKQNIELSEAPDSFVIQFSQVVLQMLKVQPANEGIDAKTLSKIFNDLKGKAIETLPRIVDHSKVFISLSDSQQFSPDVSVISESIGRLQSITKSLESATAAMLRTSQKIEVPFDKHADAEVLSEMDLAFMNAKKRVGTSWSLAVGMTGLAFLLVATLVVCAVVLTFVRAEGSWGLVFGGAGVPLVIGVLLWRPFDRIFRATILAQQIEMIHVRASTSYKMTTDLEKRIEICRDAIEGLRTLFREHEIPSKQEGNIWDK